jgi:hypothetical protein
MQDSRENVVVKILLKKRSLRKYMKAIIQWMISRGSSALQWDFVRGKVAESISLR